MDIPVTMRCDPLFYGDENRYNIIIDHINILVDDTKSVIIKVHKNATITTPSWVVVDTKIPISCDVSGTFTSARRVLFTYTISKTNQLYIDRLNIITKLIPSDILTITAQSASNTDVDCSVGFHRD
jgi:hypothetical protein